MKKPAIIYLTAFMLSACASTLPPAKTAALITAAEAKREACPTSILDAGASASDCQCIENELFKLGQVPGALTPTSEINDSITPSADLAARTAAKRNIAIGILRIEAIEQCGLFDSDHKVSKNLQGT